MGEQEILLHEILSVKHFISCILQNFYALICVFSASIYGGNVFIYVKENSKYI